MKRALLIVGSLMLALTGCGGGDKERVAYRPVSFGENGHCYYVHDPLEVLELRQAGLCDPSWGPMAMPILHRQMFYPYYASPAYYDLYVPRTMRTVYVREQKSWGSANKTGIAQASKGATYAGSNGKTVSAEKIGATKYGAGNRFGEPGAKFGGGSRATTPGSPSAPSQPTTKASGGGSGGGTNSKPPSTNSKPPAVSKPKPPSPKSPSKPSSGTKSGGYGGGSRGGSGSRR